MQNKKDIVDELNRLDEEIRRHDFNAYDNLQRLVVRFWAIRWVLKLETQAQYDEYVKGE